jgi:hypothetical protein
MPCRLNTIKVRSVTITMHQPKHSINEKNYNGCNEKSVPIDWNSILACTKPLTPVSARTYLINVVNRLNRHFAMVMNGKNTGSIEVTRMHPNPSEKSTTVTLSSWRCKELFPRKVSVTWMEAGKRRRIHTTALSLWLKSGNRREVRLDKAASAVPLSTDAAVKWLRKMLQLTEKNECPLVFNALNARTLVYNTYWDVVGRHRKHEWTPKRISQHIYRILPTSRPVKGSKVRLRGVYMIDIPSIDVCHDALAKLK